MARVRQFAKDMGMSYNQANNLVKKGRALKDGGSSILEGTMNQAKVIKANKGKITKLDTKNPGKAKVNQFKNVQNAAATGKISQKDALDKIRKIVLSKKLGGGNNLKPIPEDAKGLQALKKKRPDVVAEMGFKKKGGTLKMKSGGQFRGCGAQVKGKKFKGIF